MRTRDEQIEEIKERVEDLSLVNCYPEFSEIQDWLIEAERRAEQRVRAEIGRDSERLDWLEKSIPEYGIGRSYEKFYVDKGCLYVASAETIRKAIDAAREVG
ncbi:hypothetical protein [Acetobacter cerevisiae]|uniref:Uncharacterized protein n=1 Tax=Acetobacter cerevisiae TaxID=178900 RepID=A0A149QVY7_9PROT|nr:hypothetical protein [Acetobacter cerevisiae]KXV01470.1 hypothetical protein AD928_01550 [Acetobacter cerevisiae]GBQ10476.1 hypothetical protein AA14362_2561 [Acetobacter cerevisiae DSM 14362]